MILKILTGRSGHKEDRSLESSPPPDLDCEFFCPDRAKRMVCPTRRRLMGRSDREPVPEGRCFKSLQYYRNINRPGEADFQASREAEALRDKSFLL